MNMASSHEKKKLRLVENKLIWMSFRLCLQNNIRHNFFFTALKFRFKKEETVLHSSPSVDLGTLKIILHT